MTDNSQDNCPREVGGDAGRDTLPEDCSSSAVADSGYRLCDRHKSIRQMMGGGKAADVILWKRWSISFAIIVVATVAWLLYERSGLSSLSISSDVLLILVVVQFVRANSANLLNKQLRPLPELVLSEEMVNNAAASFRVKFNYVLLMAHDITLGKDFKLFFKVVVALWLLSVVGSYFSFFTLAYFGTIISITLPALYHKYEEQVNRYAGLVHNKISNHYSVVDTNVISRIPAGLSKYKDS